MGTAPREVREGGQWAAGWKWAVEDQLVAKLRDKVDGCPKLQWKVVNTGIDYRGGLTNIDHTIDIDYRGMGWLLKRVSKARTGTRAAANKAGAPV